MLSLLLTEWRKLKHTRMLWLVLIGALPSNLISLMELLPKTAPDGTPVGFDLQSLFYRQGMMLVMMAPSIFTLMTGYIVAREYQERTINQLFSYPVPRWLIVAAKLLVVLPLIFLTVLISCVFVFLFGGVHLFGHPEQAEAVWLGIRMNLLIGLLSFGTVPVAAALSFVGKSIIPAAVVGGMATIVTVIGEIGHGRGGILFPWLTPYWPVRHLAEGIANNVGPNPYGPAALGILLSVFVVSSAFCIVYTTKADVHSGS
ncbi:ABC transporter permease [Paenibacillus sp. CC-CFT747]|nr:ABC transporter permease [Paenibacillus sp. CC-CFT747]